MKILAIETAESACSAALWCDADILSRFEIAPRQHSELLLPMMNALLEEADIPLSQLDGLAFSAGPGSFTGLRIAAGVIQGVALGTGLDVMPVSTLQALAQRACREHDARQVLVALDARMGEVYWGGYRKKTGTVPEVVIQDSVTRPDQVPGDISGDWMGVASGWGLYSDQLKARLHQDRGMDIQVTQTLPDLQCHALDVATIAAATWHKGQAVPAEKALPSYLRNEVAKKRVNQP